MFQNFFPQGVAVDPENVGRPGLVALRLLQDHFKQGPASGPCERRQGLMTMNLSDLKPPKGAKHAKKRVGRGERAANDAAPRHADGRADLGGTL